MNRRLARALCIACATIGVFAALGVSSASAAAPCWKTLLNDWYDGHIDHVYPIPCYQQAINHLPLDVQVYSNAKQDIERARAQAIANQTSTPVTTTIGTNSTPVIVKPGPKTPPATTTTTPTTTKKASAPFFKRLSPGGADSFPLPLLILGLIAILLVLAGLGGFGWREFQKRRGTA